jgi:Fe-S-cluster containining protein
METGEAIMEQVVESCARDVAAIVDGVLGAMRPSEEAFAVVLDLVEERIAAALAGRETAAPACRAGCAACCTVNVGTLGIEGAAAARHLRKTLGRERAGAVAATLLAFHDRVRWLEDAERIRARLRCPFLDDGGRCSIHPVRPLACRAISSLDAEACRRALADRADEEGDGAVPMDVLQRAVYERALDALADALASRGLDARRRDVSGMAGAFLRDEALARSFGAGTPVPLE